MQKNLKIPSTVTSTVLLVLFLHIILVTSTPISDHDENISSYSICYGKHGVFEVIPGTCNGFYICIDGFGITGTCGNFYQFNPATGVCDHPEKVRCQDELIDPPYTSYVSLPGFPQYLPKPQTPDEVVFDKNAGDICKFERNGSLLPKPNSCTHFYVCLLQQAYRRSCPPMLHFNAEKRLCQDPALAQCLNERPYNLLEVQLSTLSSDGDIRTLTCNDVPNGILLPHQASCEKFFSCTNGQQLEIDCPDGLHFSVRHQRCEWPNIAKCQV